MSNNPFLPPQSTAGQRSTNPSPRPVYAPPPVPPPSSSLQASSSSYTPPPAAPTSAPTPGVSITPAATESDAGASTSGRERDGDEEDQVAPSEPPPPYTPAPNVWAREETVLYGPSRPFQPAPPPLRPIPPPQSTRPVSSISPRPASQQGYNPPPGAPPIPSTSTRPRSPPPRHPSTQLSPNLATHPARRAASYSGPSPFSPTATGESGTMPGAYAPPPGPPPPQTQQQSPPARQSSPPVPADGKPTRKPIPGHPLMLSGQVLVYPPRYTCHKCLNLGYKNLDVTHPCRKCWEKYGRPYEGTLLAYSDWTDRTSNFQRPLPEGIKIPSSSSSSNMRPSSASEYPGAYARSSGSNYQSFGSGSSSRAIVTNGPPPPGALVVMPGDPRIGGRLCYNCGGAGVIPAFLFFTEETCSVCRGAGRIL